MDRNKIRPPKIDILDDNIYSNVDHEIGITFKIYKKLLNTQPKLTMNPCDKRELNHSGTQFKKSQTSFECFFKK